MDARTRAGIAVIIAYHIQKIITAFLGDARRPMVFRSLFAILDRGGIVQTTTRPIWTRCCDARRGLLLSVHQMFSLRPVAAPCSGRSRPSSTCSTPSVDERCRRLVACSLQGVHKCGLDLVS